MTFNITLDQVVKAVSLAFFGGVAGYTTADFVGAILGQSIWVTLGTAALGAVVNMAGGYLNLRAPAPTPPVMPPHA